MKTTSTQINLHNPEVDHVDIHSTGVVAVTLGAYPVSVTEFHENLDAAETYALNMLAKIRLAALAAKAVS